MSMTLRCAPIKWASTSLSASNSSCLPEALVGIFDLFGVENTAGDDSMADFEVERKSLKECRSLLISGEYDDELATEYDQCLKMTGIDNDAIIKTITEILSVRTDWIHVAWF